MRNGVLRNGVPMVPAMSFAYPAAYVIKCKAKKNISAIIYMLKSQ